MEKNKEKNQYIETKNKTEVEQLEGLLDILCHLYNPFLSFEELSKKSIQEKQMLLKYLLEQKKESKKK